jgi:hypothetical protein
VLSGDARPRHQLGADAAVDSAVQYALTDARRADEDLLARRTTGKLVLRP